MRRQGAATFRYRAAESGLNPFAQLAMANGKPYSTFVVLCVRAIPGRPVGGFTRLQVVDTRS